MTTEPESPPPLPPAVKNFLLVQAPLPRLPPLMAGLLAGFAVMALFDVPQDLQAIVAALSAFGVWLFARRLLRNAQPDRVRFTGESLQLLREEVKLRQVSLGRLSEVNELPTRSGPVLLLADDKETVVIAQAQLDEPRRWDELKSAVLAGVEHSDPQGTRARTAVQAGRLRGEIAQQPVRGVPLLMGLIGFSSLFAFSFLQALASRPFPREQLGALSAPLASLGESWRVLSYPFQQESGLQLMLVLAGLLWLGSWLEKMLGWERVLVAFTVGSAAAGGAWLLTGTPLPLYGGVSGIFGLFGAIGALALVGRKSLPRALLPRRSFWVMTLVYVLVYLLVLPAVLSLGLGVDPVAYLTLWPMLFAKVAATAAGFLFTYLLTMGTSLPAHPADRRHSRPLAYLSILALGLGLAGSVLHVRAQHPFDDEILTQALVALPETPEVAAAQNHIAYLMLIRPGVQPDAVGIATRLAEASVRNSERQRPEILDTLAVGRFKQGDLEGAEALLVEALNLVKEDGTLRLLLQRRLQDVRKGGPLTPDETPFR